MSRYFNRCKAPVGTFACVLACSFPVAHAQPSRTVKDGVYTDEQSKRGQVLYQDRCSTCHGAMLGGALAPPLTGDEFLTIWGGPLSDLANKIQNTMPQNDPGKLTRQQSSEIVAYILQVARFPTGKTELSAKEAALKEITIPPPTAASPQRISVGGAQAPVFPPAGNLAQVMRGILFPSSNLIFDVQTNDPDTPPPPRPNQPTGLAFSLVDWGAGIYKGWEIVDYAAVALAESAPLMLTPGRRCENGRPVPVQDPEWIKYAMELAAAGKAAYKASQSRNQDTASAITEQLATSCSNCHQAYRDKRGGVGPPSAANQAARCVK